MTLLSVLTVLAVLGALVLVVVLFVQRREGIDLSLGTLLRAYLYVGSLAGVVVFAAGVAGIVAYVLSMAFGLDVIYGGQPPQPVPPIEQVCPPGTVCPPQPPRPFIDDRVRRQGEDLVRGVTFVVFGAVFWGAHWAARRGLGRTEAGADGLQRGYLILGTAIFGIGTIALLPVGIYEALSFAAFPGQPVYYRPGGAGEALSGGLATLPLWLAYLWLVLRVLRRMPPAPVT